MIALLLLWLLLQWLITMEWISGNYVERKDIINEWYQATKVGLDEYEAHHKINFCCNTIAYTTISDAMY